MDLIVYLGRLRDKSRRLLEITEVTGMKGEQVELNPLFLFRETGEKNGKIYGIQERVGEMKQIEKFQRAGMWETKEGISGGCGERTAPVDGNLLAVL